MIRRKPTIFRPLRLYDLRRSKCSERASRWIHYKVLRNEKDEESNKHLDRGCSHALDSMSFERWFYLSHFAIYVYCHPLSLPILPLLDKLNNRTDSTESQDCQRAWETSWQNENKNVHLMSFLE